MFALDISLHSAAHFRSVRWAAHRVYEDFFGFGLNETTTCKPLKLLLLTVEVDTDVTPGTV
jgi:hypothetical protein